MKILKNNISTILILIAVIAFASFMYHLNSKAQQEIYESPQIGDYYVFENLLKKEGFTGQNIFKVQKITDAFLYFYKPAIVWPLSTSLDSDHIEEARDMDEEGKMFSSQIFKISTKNIEKFRNKSIGDRGVRLVYIYR